MAEDKKLEGWDWIGAFYARPPVKSACHVLQDKHRVEVTFLLYLCWLDHLGLKPDQHYLTLNEETAKLRGKIRRRRRARKTLALYGLGKGVSKALLERELALEKKLFFALCDYGTLDNQGEAKLAKLYIAYKGAIPTAAGKIILKQLGV